MLLLKKSESYLDTVTNLSCSVISNENMEYEAIITLNYW